MKVILPRGQHATGLFTADRRLWKSNNYLAPKLNTIVIKIEITIFIVTNPKRNK